jgi:D-alanine-D-alanine ligase
MSNQKIEKVAVLLGGSSAEREVSLQSGKAVGESLQRQGVNCEILDLPNDLGRLMHEGFSHAFIVLHGRGGEDGTIQGLLEWLKIPYTGSGVMGSAIAMDKLKTKLLWNGLGLPNASFAMLNQDTDFAKTIQEQGGKVMVKPVREGSSIGMSVATNADQLQRAYCEARHYDDGVMAERWLDGAEYTVAVINGEALPAIRLEPKAEFYNYDAKYISSSTGYHIPCGLSEADEQAMQQLAVEAFEACGCSGWGRVDFKADDQGHMFLLEINTVPGMTSHSLVPKAAKAKGIGFDELVMMILHTATEAK